jgi:hypothetical protein
LVRFRRLVRLQNVVEARQIVDRLVVSVREFVVRRNLVSKILQRSALFGDGLARRSTALVVQQRIVERASKIDARQDRPPRGSVGMHVGSAKTRRSHLDRRRANPLLRFRSGLAERAEHQPDEKEAPGTGRDHHGEARGRAKRRLGSRQDQRQAGHGYDVVEIGLRHRIDDEGCRAAAKPAISGSSAEALRLSFLLAIKEPCR